MSDPTVYDLLEVIASLERKLEELSVTVGDLHQALSEAQQALDSGDLQGASYAIASNIYRSEPAPDM